MVVLELQDIKTRRPRSISDLLLREGHVVQSQNNEECLAVPLVGSAEPVEAPPGVALGSGLEVAVEGAPPTNGTAGHSSNAILGPNNVIFSEQQIGNASWPSGLVLARYPGIPEAREVPKERFVSNKKLSDIR